MSLLLLGKHNASSFATGRASLGRLISTVQQKLPRFPHTLHNSSTSRQQACFSSAPESGSSAGAGSLKMQDLDENAVELVRQIHNTNRKAVFYVAGGGVQVHVA